MDMDGSWVEKVPLEMAASAWETGPEGIEVSFLFGVGNVVKERGHI